MELPLFSVREREEAGEPVGADPEVRKFISFYCVLQSVSAFEREDEDLKKFVAQRISLITQQERLLERECMTHFQEP